MADVINLDEERDKKFDEPKSFIEKTDELCRKKLGLTKEEYENIKQKFIRHAESLDW